MPKPLYIFDIDGTLTDSIPTYIAVITKVMNDLGLKDIDTDYDNYLHHTDRYALAYNYKRNFDKPITDELCLEVDELFAQEMKHHPPITEIPGARKTLKILQQQQIPFAYGTGAFPKATAIKMADAQLPLVEEVLATSINSITREGFVKEAISKAKKHYQQEHFDRIIAVGDGIWDLKAAQAVGIDFIGIGLKNKAQMMAAGCTTWVENLIDFPIAQ